MSAVRLSCGLFLLRSAALSDAEREATFYSTVTDFARLRGWSISQPFRRAMW
jgi:hypothetical protein